MSLDYSLSYGLLAFWSGFQASVSSCIFFFPSLTKVQHLFASCLSWWDIKLCLCAGLSSDGLLDCNLKVVPSDLLLMCALISTIFLLSRGETIILSVLHLGDPFQWASWCMNGKWLLEFCWWSGNCGSSD